MASRLWTPDDLTAMPVSWLDCDTCRVDTDAGGIVGVYDKGGHSFRPCGGYTYGIGESRINGRRWLGGVLPADSSVRLSLGCLTGSGWLQGAPGVTVVGTWWRLSATGSQTYLSINNVDAAGTAATTTAQAMLQLAVASASNGNLIYGWRRLSTDTQATATLTTGLSTTGGLVLSSRLRATDATASIHCGPSSAWGSLTAQAGITRGTLGGCSRTQYQVMYGFQRANSSGSGALALGESLIYAEALSDDDVAKVEGYLAHKWGVADSLPESHPYKAAPPQVDEPAPPAPRPVEPGEPADLRVRPAKGQTWGSLALRYYYDEAQMARLIAANPALSSLLVFTGAEEITVPVVAEDTLTAEADKMPPWRR